MTQRLFNQMEIMGNEKCGLAARMIGHHQRTARTLNTT